MRLASVSTEQGIRQDIIDKWHNRGRQHVALQGLRLPQRLDSCKWQASFTPAMMT